MVKTRIKVRPLLVRHLLSNRHWKLLMPVKLITDAIKVLNGAILILPCTAYSTTTE